MKRRTGVLAGALAAMLMVSSIDSAVMAQEINQAESIEIEVDQNVTNGWEKDSYGDWYYYENGERVTGWKKIDGFWYYFTSWGEMCCDGIDWTDDGEPQLFDENGHWMGRPNGWFKTSQGWQYYKDGEGQLSGWQKIDGKWYYFDDYIMVTGLHSISDNDWSRFYFGADGAMKTGWVNVTKADIGDRYSRSIIGWHYFTSEGDVTDQWLQIGGKWYYFDWHGVMETGYRNHGGKNYYFGSSGAMLNNGWAEVKESDCEYSAGEFIGWHYYKSGRELQDEWLQLNGKWYYFDWDGVMCANGYWNSDGKTYYFDKNGVMQNSCNRSLFGNDTCMNLGWEQHEGVWFYFTKKDTGRYINGYWYSDYNAVCAKGWKQLGGKWYYFDPEYGGMQKGLTEIGSVKYFFDCSSGAMLTNTWKENWNSWYYFGSNGAAVTGWKQLSGKWYYFDRDGMMIQNSRYFIDGKYYTFNEDGVWVQ